MDALILLVLLVVIGGPVLLVVSVVQARRRLAALERRLQQEQSRYLRLERQVRRLWESQTGTPLPDAGPGPAAAQAADAGSEATRPASPPEPPGEPAPKRPAETPPPMPSRSSLPIEDWLAAAKAWLLGGNTVVRVGMIVVLFGVAFFLRFAFDQGWVPVQIRLLAAAAGGLALTGLGWRLRERRRDFAVVLQGGGAGVVYLTVFASANFYDLIGTGTATALMVVLVALASALAVAQSAPSLAVLATTGGFLAPVLVSSGGSHVALFGYYLVLDLGILGIACFRAWRTLNLLGFVFTFGIGSAWGARYYQPEFFASTEPFLVTFFLLYVAVPILYATRAPAPERAPAPGAGLVDGSLVFGTPLIAFGLQSALVGDTEYGLAFSAVAAALLYVALAVWLRRDDRNRFGLLAEVFLALSVVFATVAIPLAFDARWTGVLWAVEGAGVVWVGVRQGRVLAWLAGLTLQVAAAGAFFLALPLAPAPGIPMVNGIFLGAVLIALSGFASAWHLRNVAAPYAAGTLAWGAVWWFGAGLNEIDTFVAQTHRIHAALLFTVVSLAVSGALRSRLMWPMLAFPGMALLPAMAVAAARLFRTEEHAFPVSGLLVWAAAFGAGLWLLHRQDTHRDWPPAWIWSWHIGTLWLGVFLLSWETAWILAQAGGDQPAWQMVGWILCPLAAIAGLPMWIRKAEQPGSFAWPLAPHADAYRSSLFLPAFLGTFWIFVASFQAGAPAPLPYVVILNPLELTQIAALIVIVRWVSSTSGSCAWVRELLPPSRLGPATGVAGFVILNGMIARATHLYGGVPFRMEALWDSATYQAAASITWTLAALIVMVTANRWQRRAVWGTGAALLGLAVAKLFLVDLAGAGTVARIVSFLVVGTLILLIGYLSPLPPRAMEPDGR